MTDLQALELLEKACFLDPWSERVLAEGLRNENYLILIEKNAEGIPLGYLIGWQVGEEAELARIGVAPEARRQGYAKAILNQALTNWQERGVSRVFLEVREDNAVARQLYESRGFQLIGKRARYYPDGTNALVLALENVSTP